MVAGAEFEGFIATVENGEIVRTGIDKAPGTAFASAGPVVTRAGGGLWVFEEDEPELYVSVNAGATFAASADPMLPRAGKKVAGMDVGADGSVYLALKGPGVIVSRPAWRRLGAVGSVRESTEGG